MNSKLILGIVVIIVLGALGWFFYATSSTKSDQPAATTTEESSATSSAEVSGENKITYNDYGFAPQSVTVKSGESITWVNDSIRTVQVGSALHPTHTVNQEITGNDFVIELAPGESSKVQLTKTGEWGYHDHLMSSMTGKIIVQ